MIAHTSCSFRKTVLKCIITLRTLLIIPLRVLLLCVCLLYMKWKEFSNETLPDNSILFVNATLPNEADAYRRRKLKLKCENRYKIKCENK